MTLHLTPSEVVLIVASVLFVIWLDRERTDD